MTTNLALSLPLDLPSRRGDRAAGHPLREERRRPELVEVAPTRAQRRARPRVLAATVGVAALGALLLAQLGISMVLSQGAYRLNALQSEQTEPSRPQQALTERLDVLKSPQNLAANAQALGMIANTTPVYLDPKTGQVFGTPTPASASDSTANTANQVANQLLEGVGVVTKQGDTATSAEQPGTATATPLGGASGTAAGSATSTTSTTAGATGAATTGSTGAAATGSTAASTTGGGTSTGASTTASAAASTSLPGNTPASSASGSGSSTGSVSSDANQLQAPTTR